MPASRCGHEPRERRARCSVRSIASPAAAALAAASSSPVKRSATMASSVCSASLIARPAAFRASTSVIDPNDDFSPTRTLPLPVCALATRRRASTSGATPSSVLAFVSASAIRVSKITRRGHHIEIT